MVKPIPSQNCRSRIWAALAACSLGWTATAATVLQRGHVDLDVAFEDGALELHWHVHEPEPEGTLFEPEDLVLEVGPAAATFVPANPAYWFLGPPGSQVYVLPVVEHPELPFLGLSAEEISPGLFAGNQILLGLVNATGPGQVAVYSVDPFGSPTLWMYTGDGISAADAYTLYAGSHAHLYWAFTAPGSYDLEFVARGQLEGGSWVESDPGRFSFVVVPEPAAGALGLLGMALWLIRRRLAT